MSLNSMASFGLKIPSEKIYCSSILPFKVGVVITTWPVSGLFISIDKPM